MLRWKGPPHAVYESWSVVLPNKPGQTGTDTKGRRVGVTLSDTVTLGSLPSVLDSPSWIPLHSRPAFPHSCIPSVLDHPVGEKVQVSPGVS
jgi:hypothetical protein